MNTRRVQREIPITPRTPKNSNIASGQSHGRNLELARRKFIDDLVCRTNSSTGARYQGSSFKRSPISPRVEASVSTVENTRGSVTPSGLPVKEDKFSGVGEEY